MQDDEKLTPEILARREFHIKNATKKPAKNQEGQRNGRTSPISLIISPIPIFSDDLRHKRSSETQNTREHHEIHRRSKNRSRRRQRR